ncbi:MAG: hypothetical protein AAGB51_09445 [Planctomycetota bacterium]
MPDVSRQAQSTAEPAPLWSVLAFVFLNSLGTGPVTNGIFFLAREAYGFSEGMSFALGIALGVTFSSGAIAVGPALRALAHRLAWLTSRGVLATLMVMLGLVNAVPWFADYVGLGGPWTIWTLTMVYGALTGALWPITEAYLSGGRNGPLLRVATGRFNVVWSIAVVLSFWLMAPLVEDDPLGVLLALSGVHLVCIGLLAWHPREPAAHVEEIHEPHPKVYVSLLRSARFLHTSSYILLAALNPLLAIVLDRSGLKVEWQTPLASTWMASRVIAFVVMERTKGWHGKRWVVPAGASLLGLGFTGCLVVPNLLSGTSQLVVLGISLALFGAGLGLVYSAAIYYAMSVGNAEVDAGGKHEALVGVGYTTGPMLMLIGLWLTGATGTSWAGEALVISACLLLLCWASAMAFKRPPVYT